MTPESEPRQPLPAAVIKPRHEGNYLLWLIPAGAVILLFAIFLFSRLFGGTEITIHFQDGYGLKPGNLLRYRGVTVGQIQEIRFSEKFDSVIITAVLMSQARNLAREGAVFFVVRPYAGLYGIQGLDTIIGARYIGMTPGSGPSCREFIGSEEPPVVESIQESGLRILLQAPRRGSIRSGMPIVYRQIQVGTVIGAKLACDATGVEIQAVIFPEYACLIRENTRFWDASGFDLNLGILKGLNIDVDSLQSIIAGSIALAVPETPGAIVQSGHSFPLAVSPEKEWFEWSPPLPLGGAPFQVAQEPVPAVPAWINVGVPTLGGLFTKTVSRKAWLVPGEHGFWGPSDFLAEGEIQIESSSGPVVLTGPRKIGKAGVSFIRHLPMKTYWPKDRIETLSQPSDCAAFRNSASDPLYIPARNMVLNAGVFNLSGLTVSTKWRGASVVSRDGRLWGILVVSETGRASVVPIEAP